MAFQNKIKGLNKTLKNLNKEVKKIEGKTLKGLIRGGLIVLRDVEKKSPLTPVDLGNLRASRFLVSSKGGISMGRNPKFVKGGKAKVSKLAAGHSNLLNEATAAARKQSRPTVLFGFSAKYAAPVHEMPNSTNWSRPGSGRKFFEKAIYRNIKNIVKVIQKEARIKK